LYIRAVFHKLKQRYTWLSINKNNSSFNLEVYRISSIPLLIIGIIWVIRIHHTLLLPHGGKFALLQIGQYAIFKGGKQVKPFVRI
jgi:hypothetical protein